MNSDTLEAWTRRALTSLDATRVRSVREYIRESREASEVSDQANEDLEAIRRGCTAELMRLVHEDYDPTDLSEPKPETRMRRANWLLECIISESDDREVILQ